MESHEVSKHRMPTSSADILELYPGGYPVHIDLPQADVGGLATAMRFDLPLRGFNFPLTHRFEHKLVLALRGSLQVRSGRTLIATLAQGTGVMLAPGTRHRIAQHGATGSTVGVLLWPGAVEQAFREVAQQVRTSGVDMDGMRAILARYGVSWDGGQATGEIPVGYRPQPAARSIDALPQALQAIVQARLPHFLASPPPRTAA